MGRGVKAPWLFLMKRDERKYKIKGNRLRHNPEEAWAVYNDEIDELIGLNQQFDEDSDIFKAESLAALIMLAFYRIDVCELQQYKDES